MTVRPGCSPKAHLKWFATSCIPRRRAMMRATRSLLLKEDGEQPSSMSGKAWQTYKLCPWGCKIRIRVHGSSALPWGARFFIELILAACTNMQRPSIVFYNGHTSADSMSQINTKAVFCMPAVRWPLQSEAKVSCINNPISSTLSMVHESCTDARAIASFTAMLLHQWMHEGWNQLTPNSAFAAWSFIPPYALRTPKNCQWPHVAIQAFWTRQ